MAKAKHFAFNLPFMALKVGGKEQNFLFFGHAWNSKHRTWKFKTWSMQKFWFSASYFKAESRMLRVKKIVLCHIANCSIPKVGNKD
jgi:hypothetical protein